MAPVILETDVHCLSCAKKIRKTIRNLLGVERVWASPETGLVVVAGTADAAVLKRRIQHRMRRRVTILSDGSMEPNPAVHWGMAHLAPQQYSTPPPPGYPAYSWGAAPPHHYAQQHAGGGHHWTPYPRHYVPGGAPTRSDDEAHPDGCCSIQ